MVLIKHGVNEVPPLNKKLLIMIDLGGQGSKYNWTIGYWEDNTGWHCEFDDMGYKVIAWYELPIYEKIKENFSYHQMRMEEFWENR